MRPEERIRRMKPENYDGTRTAAARKRARDLRRGRKLKGGASA